MKKKSGLVIYSLIWIIAILILGFSIYQNLGDAQVINYSGIIRGGTQKLIKNELVDVQDDDSIQYLNDILFDLETGKGEFGLNSNHSAAYKSLLEETKTQWEDIKNEIQLIRNGSDKQILLDKSETYFDLTNRLVASAEMDSNRKLSWIIMTILVYLALSIGFFSLWYHRKSKEIHTIKKYDDLTKIYNFEAFIEEAQLTLCSRFDEDFILVYLDIDDFKILNTSYGYLFGDELLKIIANALHQYLKEGELCCRVNADNFLILMKHDPKAIDSLKALLNEHIKNQASLKISDEISFCIGVFPITIKEYTKADVQSMIDNANMAHKKAKSKGNDQSVWYDDNFLKQLYFDNMIIKRIHSAIKNKEFQMYLQPKFDIRDTKIIAAEALVRWQFSQDQILYPDSFIPQLENNGLISELDLYMLEQACAFLQEHQLSETGFTIAVNFSRVTLFQRDLYERIHEILDAHAIPSHAIEIEVTESAFNDISDTVIHTLNTLKEDGFHISMDDFGTGYSSLNLLNTLSIDILKIDRTFLEQIDQKGKSIIELIIHIAHTFQIKVICEGIETIEQLDYLQSVGCDMGQGYYVSKPIPEKDFYQQYLKGRSTSHIKQQIENYVNAIQVDECLKLIMTNMESVIYLADMNTYELIYLNQSGRKLLQISDDSTYRGKKCYVILQGMSSPCPFCTNGKLCQGSYLEWTHHNTFLHQDFAIMDKKISLENGRDLRLEVAYVISKSKHLTASTIQ